MTASLTEKIAAIPFWYHRIPLPGGITTPGWAPMSPALYRVPEDLTGRRVLDVGAWDGYWTFEALRRGAKEVVAIDDFSDTIGANLGIGRTAKWQTFDLCRAALGYDEKRCQRTEMTVYDLSPEVLGTFDTVFFFGVLYHLRYPMLALDKLAAVCNSDIHIESAILDDCSPYQGGVGHGYSGQQMVMEFYPGNEYADNPSNWWAPTLLCLAQMLKAAGFPTITGWKMTEKPTKIPQCRGFLHGQKQARPAA